MIIVYIYIYIYRYIRYTVYDIRYTTFSYIVYITLVRTPYEYYMISLTHISWDSVCKIRTLSERKIYRNANFQTGLLNQCSQILFTFVLLISNILLFYLTELDGIRSSVYHLQVINE